MGYMSTHLTEIKKHHYVMTATSWNYWYNFYAGPVKRKISEYGNNFCLVINGSNKDDDAYILPYKHFKNFFSPDYLDDHGRWIGTIRGHQLYLTLKGLPEKSMSVEQYYNAFGLLEMPR